MQNCTFDLVNYTVTVGTKQSHLADYKNKHSKLIDNKSNSIKEEALHLTRSECQSNTKCDLVTALGPQRRPIDLNERGNILKVGNEQYLSVLRIVSIAPQRIPVNPKGNTQP